ncbi:MAG TPA: L,D-transpeptidase [Terriglobales bacterium]|nr:L,D-transpeptidase [Terriglobales bacterium]
MREISRRQLKKAGEKALIFLSLMALMMVPGSSETIPAAGPRTTEPKSATGRNATRRQKRVVLVSIPDRKLALLEDGKVTKVYRVAVGSSASPSPSGEFAIVNRITNPTYYHPHVVIPASEESPIGTRWVGLNRKGYGIHGTNELRSIGRAASHGCIRMSNRDIAQLFEMVRIGDLVEIHAERDADTARVFGSVATMQDLAEAQATAGQ